MKAFIPIVYALVIVMLIRIAHGADMCGSDKSAENLIVLDKGNTSLIRSSNSTVVMPHIRMTCAWKVTAPPGYSVKIRVYIADSSEQCSEENVQIFDGAASSDPLLWEFCKTKPKKIGGPVAFFSSGENARIVLKTGSNPNTTFFIAFVKAVKRHSGVCTNDAVYNLAASPTVASFQSPYYPNGYPLNASCGWKIVAPTGKIVKLQFKGAFVDCFEDSLLVYDGEDEKQDDLIKRLCMYQDLNEAIYSYGQTLFVKFKSNSELKHSRYDGFLAHYSAVDGGTTCSPSNSAEVNSCITSSASSGRISSPGFPTVVPPVPITCIWRLRAPVGHVVKLDLETISVKFRIASNGYSNVVGLTIKSGQGLDVYKIGSFSFQNYMSETLVSDGRRLQVEYKQTDDIKTGKRPIGFDAKYETLPLVTTGSCNANQAGTIDLKGEAATFHSLNYPNKHPANMNCTWKITVNAGQVIQFRFRTLLSSDCSENWMKIYDGATKSSPVISKLCKNQYTHLLYSTSNQVLVEFMGTKESNGFYATYVARMAAPKPYACLEESSEKLNVKSGKLASQGFPLPYANNVYCRWTITVPFQHVIKFTITALDLQPDSSCEKDALRLFDKQEIGSSRLAWLCGKNSTALTFKTSYNKMTVEFWSDDTGRYPGFEASFEAEPDPSFGNCTKQFVSNIIPLSSPSGTIFTPRYPKYYPPNMMCTWKIQAPKEKWIRLSFPDLYLESCASSSVDIRDGIDASSKLIQKLCDNRFEPVVIYSSGSGLWVHFRSGSDRFTNRGFTAHYEVISQLPLSISCKDTSTQKLKDSPGSIASRDYPLKYANNAKCTWIISTSSSERFRIKFDFMDIEPSPGCRDDYVIIRDGGYSFSDSLGQFCGSTKPDTLTSSEDAIWVQFVSNGTGRYPGFKLSYETTYNVRTIVLISVFSAIGVIGFLVVVGWIVKYCCCSDDDFGNEGEAEMIGLQKDGERHDTAV